jgi:hypothetical protein
MIGHFKQVWMTQIHITGLHSTRMQIDRPFAIGRVPPNFQRFTASEAPSAKLSFSYHILT